MHHPHHGSSSSGITTPSRGPGALQEQQRCNEQALLQCLTRLQDKTTLRAAAGELSLHIKALDERGLAALLQSVCATGAWAPRPCARREGLRAIAQLPLPACPVAPLVLGGAPLGRVLAHVRRCLGDADGQVRDAAAEAAAAFAWAGAQQAVLRLLLEGLAEHKREAQQGAAAALLAAAPYVGPLLEREHARLLLRALRSPTFGATAALLAALASVDAATGVPGGLLQANAAVWLPYLNSLVGQVGGGGGGGSEASDGGNSSSGGCGLLGCLGARDWAVRRAAAAALRTAAVLLGPALEPNGAWALGDPASVTHRALSALDGCRFDKVREAREAARDAAAALHELHAFVAAEGAGGDWAAWVAARLPHCLPPATVPPSVGGTPPPPRGGAGSPSPPSSRPSTAEVLRSSPISQRFRRAAVEGALIAGPGGSVERVALEEGGGGGGAEGGGACAPVDGGGNDADEEGGGDDARAKTEPQAQEQEQAHEPTQQQPAAAAAAAVRRSLTRSLSSAASLAARSSSSSRRSTAEQAVTAAAAAAAAAAPAPQRRPAASRPAVAAVASAPPPKGPGPSRPGSGSSISSATTTSSTRVAGGGSGSSSTPSAQEWAAVQAAVAEQQHQHAALAAAVERMQASHAAVVAGLERRIAALEQQVQQQQQLALEPSAAAPAPAPVMPGVGGGGITPLSPGRGRAGSALVAPASSPARPQQQQQERQQQQQQQQQQQALLQQLLQAQSTPEWQHSPRRPSGLASLEHDDGGGTPARTPVGTPPAGAGPAGGGLPLQQPAAQAASPLMLSPLAAGGSDALDAAYAGAVLHGDRGDVHLMRLAAKTGPCWGALQPRTAHALLQAFARHVREGVMLHRVLPWLWRLADEASGAPSVPPPLRRALLDALAACPALTAAGTGTGCGGSDAAVAASPPAGGVGTDSAERVALLLQTLRAVWGE